MRSFSNSVALAWLALALLTQPGCRPDDTGSTELPPLPEVDPDSFVAVTREKLKEPLGAARERPDDAGAVGRLGMVLHAHDQFGLAEKCYQRARGLDPDSFRWLYYLGITQLRQGKNAEAVKTLGQAAAREPPFPMLRVRMGEALLAQGQLQSSAENYRAVLEADPANAEAHFGLGRVLAAQGETKEAVQQLEEACRLAPNFGAAHYELALLYRDLGDTQKSQQHLEIHEKHKTTSPPSNDPLMAALNRLKDTALDHLGRGVKLEAAGDLEGAIREHEKALEIDPQIVQAHINLLILYGKMGRLDDAARHYEAAYELNPNQAELHYNYGVLAYDHGRFQEARTAFGRALEINPNYARAHTNLGQMLEMDRRFDDALAHYEKAIENRPNYRLAHFHRGRILLMKGRPREAIQAFEKTLEPEDERTAGFLYALTAAYARTGDRAKALDYGKKALQLAQSHGQRELAAKIEADLKKLSP